MSDASGFRYLRANYLADMDEGFYWRTTCAPGSGPRRSAPTFAAPWGRTGGGARDRAFLRDLFAEGTRPSSEEVAARIDAEPLDVDPLVGGLTAAVA